MEKRDREREGCIKKRSATILKNGLCMSNAPKVLGAEPQALPKTIVQLHTHMHKHTLIHITYVLNNYNF